MKYPSNENLLWLVCHVVASAQFGGPAAATSGVRACFPFLRDFTCSSGVRAGGGDGGTQGLGGGEKEEKDTC